MKVSIQFERIDWLLSALLVVGALGMHFAPWQVIEELSLALFISSFLGLSLDQLLRQRLIREVAGGVAPHYITYGLPGEVASEIIFIKGIKLLRKDYTIRLSFREVAGDPSHLVVDSVISYSVVNYTDRDVEYPHRLRVVQDRISEQNRILSISATGVDLRGHEYDNNYGGEQKKEFDQTVRIPPNKANPRNTFEARTSRIAEAHDSDVVFLQYATLNLEVRVEDKPRDLDLEVHIGHRLHDHKVETIPPASPTRWRLEAALLPWSAVYVVWKKQQPRALPGGAVVTAEG